MAEATFKNAGSLYRHGTRRAGRFEATHPGLIEIMRPWLGRPTLPYIYQDATEIGKGLLFMSFELRTERNPDDQDGFMVMNNLLGMQIAWGNSLSSIEVNEAIESILGPGRCEVPVDVDYFGRGRGVISIRRPDAVIVELGQQEAAAKHARLVENTRQYRTPAETRKKRA